MASRPGPLGTPLGQFGLGAIALVLGGALLFALIGAVQGQDGDPVAAPGTTDPTGDPSPDAGTDAPPVSDGATDTTTDAPTGTDAPTDAPTATPTDGGTTEEPAVAPADVTIQVLNGAGSSAPHDAVVGCLESAGYDDLITSNRARTTYDTTTVFYTAGEGNEAIAQQVADALGIASVEEQPGNLSESVPVHVVSGQDGTDLC